ncbi:phospholipase D family protein [Paraburkholderia sp. UYCP14C]|uniref:phospholipase D family nuclease n=1 Tax=Paraburkholderia sp. UYCP14C TaxID=2511130 RepID=UPI0010206C24|nr:phospholipase D family protein [Paraburkholderia sp. UYCP14C]RZF23532.1 phospholipase D family protein [Paraburkholderia sp. UYCP14C]
MKPRERLVITCLTAALIFAAPFATGRSLTDSLLDQARGIMSPASPSGALGAPAGQAVEVGFSPEGDAEALVLKVIGSAHTSIRLAGYSFTSPKVVGALLEAKRRSVDVAVVVDDKGNRSKTSQQALNLLVNAGIPTRTIERYAINHDKFVVVDGRHLETGSFNYSAAAATRNSENVLVLWNNPALAGRYLQHWQSRFDQGRDYRSSY